MEYWQPPVAHRPWSMHVVRDGVFSFKCVFLERVARIDTKYHRKLPVHYYVCKLFFSYFQDSQLLNLNAFS